MSQKKLITLFENHFWRELALVYPPNEIVQNLSFRDSLLAAYCLLYNDQWDENLQEYAVKLFCEIQRVYPEDWNRSWEFDALLGMAYDITLKYDERYQAYKKAFDRTKSPPPGLLIELAQCCICPGSPPISYDQAIDLIVLAMKDQLYTDGISVLCNIYSIKEDQKMKKYWTDVLETLPPQATSPSIVPAFLVQEYLKILQEKKNSERL